ncbi:MAG: hypothetical protein IPN23_09445 [Elusimicrobia bacterium]|nr:hypothetical protein [Elusimicrobiota bacterium]
MCRWQTPAPGKRNGWRRRNIRAQFSGTVQAQLLAALRRAEKGLPAFDGSIEETSDGVILRALKDGAGRQQFQAELRLKRAPSGLDA